MSATPSRGGCLDDTNAARVVVVTGASSGIGRATAQAAAARGDHLVLVARGRPSLDEPADECRRAGAASADVLLADVGVDAAVRDVVAETIARHGRIDVVVNAAGVVAYGRTEDVPADVFDGVLRTNLNGSVNVARHVLPVLRSQGSGSLVMVGSVIGHLAVPSMTPYVLSKWGVRALAAQLRIENRDVRGVHVVYVAPGGVGTPIYAQAANFSGFEGRPPPPVAGPAHTARQILRRADTSHPRSQLSLANEVIRFGYTALPPVYAALVGPLFRLAATDLTRPVAPYPGNVLTSGTEANALHGDQNSAVVGVVRNVRAAWLSRVPAKQPGPSSSTRPTSEGT